MGLKDYLREISVPVFAAVCVFAVSSWISINGVWVELPLMVNVLPESWDLPSYLVIIIQIANVGPLIFAIAKRLAPNVVSEWWVVYIIIGIGSVASLLLVFFWDRTSVVNGAEHSTALLSLTAILALVDCTSSVVFLPYMALFPPQYLTSFYVGEGLSGLIPAIVGLIQGVGSDPICVNVTITESNSTSHMIVPEYPPPLFTVNVFFGILFVLLCLSCLAFTIVHFHPSFKCHRVSTAEITPAGTELHHPPYSISPEISQDPTPTDSAVDVSSEDAFYANSETGKGDEDKDVNGKQSSVSESSNFDTAQFSVLNWEVLCLLVMVGWINALTNGFLPSIQSYSCLPYGNLAYNLANRLSVLANPLACFFGLVVQVKKVFVVAILTVIGTILAGYQAALAALSPEPPLHDQTAGIVLVVLTFVLLTAVFSYAKLSIASMLSARGAAKGLLWCGGVTQIGSCIGAVITFVLVNVLKLFESKYPCT